MDVRVPSTRDGKSVAVVLPGVRDLLPLAAANPSRYPCLLESVSGGSRTARYDILFAFPQTSVTPDENFLGELDRAWRNERRDERDELPFHGGWFVFLTYELAMEIEPSLRLPRSSTLPTAIAVRCPAAIVVDRVTQTTTLIAESEFASSLAQLRDDLDSSSEFDAAVAIESVEEDDPPVPQAELQSDHSEQQLPGADEAGPRGRSAAASRRVASQGDARACR